MRSAQVLRNAFRLLALPITASVSATRNLIIDTDIFSDVDDTGALLLAATSPNVNLLAVNINVGSTYSALAASAILAHYGKGDVPIGIVRPLANTSFFDDYAYELGEYASKVAYHFGSPTNSSSLSSSYQPMLPWPPSNAEKTLDPVFLYRSKLVASPDGSVTIASIGFFENLSALLNSTADALSPLNGTELVRLKVERLVVMGGMYPAGREFNFFGDNPSLTAHVINTWRGLTPIVFSGGELGGSVMSGMRLMQEGPQTDPVRQAYMWYTYGAARPSWDPLTVLFAMGDGGLGDLFEYGNEFGYNHVFANGSNEWVYDEAVTDQRFLRLRVSNETAAAELDRLYLVGANSAGKGL
ncbi:inosine/uridine-preferring nucleoside hydrolase [Apiospora saccharicola]|uniref:Inosine/uridine-preferring nucleoside hydrolase n=1 Tax=Apiospora saccharicola TaxID=335842 RepID=A0ABR1W0U4_9PEZI